MLQRIKAETAKLLKEKGFNYPCNMLYNDKDELSGTKMDMGGLPNNYEGYYAAYYLDEVIKFYREADNMHIEPYYASALDLYNVDLRHDKLKLDTLIEYKTYEEAQEAGIIKAIELI